MIFCVAKSDERRQRTKNHWLSESIFRSICYLLILTSIVIFKIKLQGEDEEPAGHENGSMENGPNDSNGEQHITGDRGEATDEENLQEPDEEVILCVRVW